ncbi:pilus assembly protein TadC [Sphingomonas sp. BE123]|jgi:pilus assembly protein TadC|uniref:hypothetical protein n=1 Tax=unclassified Sphingomonas TaxID=196159 RepID=UPI00285E0A13|nr:hypothetical protein [Sphingomonas sp. BE123]MDR6850952.1 pilus assembly protein TadC [Sphingomonas sp. BE123]
MQFLKALFWFLILGLAAAFAVTNWHPVEIHLWSGLIADVNLPFLLFVIYLGGLLPMLAIYHTMRWRMRSRIAMLEQTVDALRPAPAPVAAAQPVQDPGEAAPVDASQAPSVS